MPDVVDASVLLDTCALLWWATADKALGRKVKRLLANDSTKVFVSSASAWEITTKVRLGKLEWKGPDSVETYCIRQRFELLPITFAHAEKAGAWPQPHGDPFDRMIAAQSALEGVPLATNDAMLKRFGVQTIW
ncbi:MAG TPA: type II toxin-antitoxin system VapC family toxin [Kofleriaceae bacterium]|nr:type II toxin-antitoxin system VapC family toxin [Kofleriaceae bacterium]